ncbi:hypothetical protein IKE84_02005 [Candidatus Saccharibacteria bacterium]|nr:hypothetical protein [Candidatus Saccharibacteria bacterium]
MSKKKTDGSHKGIQVLRTGHNAVDIYFDFHEINATENSLKPLRKKIIKKSSNRLFLNTLFASYGILTLKENLAIEPNSREVLSFERAERLIIKELEDMRE